MPQLPILLGVLFLSLVAGCNPKRRDATLSVHDTIAELRVVKGQVTVTERGKVARKPYPRERLTEGVSVKLDSDALTWMRQDSGALMLLSGPAKLSVGEKAFNLESGRIFVDTQGSTAVTLQTPSGNVEVAEGRSSIRLAEDRTAEIYTLRGSARFGATRIHSGELLRIDASGKSRLERSTAWDDWTLGLATADPEAQPAPFGVGTIGARLPQDQGKPRFSLVISRLEVKVTIQQDFATTEVDETFVNPSASAVEGLYSFRVPPSGLLSRFGVDRDGVVVWGKVKEKQQAKAQYESNVYAGSTEDPALLEWVQRGVYQARLYPIAAGSTRRLVTRYSEWLGRQGDQGERRLYVYPMAASGAEGTLPRIEEMTLRIDWSKARATHIRAPKGAIAQGHQIVLKAHDFSPKADVAVELFDAGSQELVAYRAKHNLFAEDVPVDADKDFEAKVAAEEPDYVLVPLPAAKEPELAAGVDLSIVVDSSAATDPRAFAVARHLVQALLSALGPNDRAALFTGDSLLRPVLPESNRLSSIDETKRKAYLAALAGAPIGGATDLGNLFASAAERLEAQRRGAVIYIGDGRPSVGEMLSKPLRERLERLPPSTRLLAAGVGPEVNAALLESLVRGGPLELVGNSYEAAIAALKLLEAASGSSWQGSVAQMTGVDRLLPRQVPSVGVGEPTILVGRVAGTPGSEISLGHGGVQQRPKLRVVHFDDGGDLRRRWGESRLAELNEQQAGRLALVELARRYGLVTPFTSLYVATKREVEQDQNKDKDQVASNEQPSEEARFLRWKPWRLLGGGVLSKEEPPAAAVAPVRAAGEADNKEGGTGTRAKGEEGSMGAPQPGASRRYAVQELSAATPEERALAEAQQFGLSGLAGNGDFKGVKPAPATKAMSVSSLDRVAGFSASVGDSAGSEEPRAGSGTGQGFGSGRGRLSGSHRTLAPRIRMNPIRVQGRLDATVAERVMRQNYGRFRQCFEQGLARNPNLAGKLTLSIQVNESGSVNYAAPTEIELADTEVVACAVKVALATTFPPPDQGRVTLQAPIVFSGGQPGDSPVADPSADQPSEGPTKLARVPHGRKACSSASNQPLPERRKLWAERLRPTANAFDALRIYQTAIRFCEATSFLERQHLLYAIVDRLPSIAERVAFYRLLLDSPTAAASVYRAILTRIQDAESMKQLHSALGIKRPDDAIVSRLFERVTAPLERVQRLRALLREWPDDMELMLRLLDALEDSAEYAEARSLARGLRRRSDASSHLRTLVGEFHLRLASRGDAETKRREESEAQRCFGEIVEFAPEDPAARRRLGDLLRAHGWYEEAFRQYETLKLLLPEDATIDLLLAEAAFGMGKIEEALRWTEKARAATSSDGLGELEVASRAWASAFLGWAYLAAVSEKKTQDAERLLARGRRLATNDLGVGAKLLLTWEHPELRPALWLKTSAGEVPAKNMTLLGVAEERATDTTEVEIRIDPEDAERVARLGAEVTLTAITNEGTSEQKVNSKRLRFGSRQLPRTTLRLRYENGSLHEESL